MTLSTKIAIGAGAVALAVGAYFLFVHQGGGAHPPAPKTATATKPGDNTAAVITAIGTSLPGIIDSVSSIFGSGGD